MGVFCAERGICSAEVMVLQHGGQVHKDVHRRRKLLLSKTEVPLDACSLGQNRYKTCTSGLPTSGGSATDVLLPLKILRAITFSHTVSGAIITTFKWLFG